MVVAWLEEFLILLVSVLVIAASSIGLYFYSKVDSATQSKNIIKNDRYFLIAMVSVSVLGAAYGIHRFKKKIKNNLY